MVDNEAIFGLARHKSATETIKWLTMLIMLAGSALSALVT